MKQAKIFMYSNFAGILTEDENGYRFEYDSVYLDRMSLLLACCRDCIGAVSIQPL